MGQSWRRIVTGWRACVAAALVLGTVAVVGPTQASALSTQPAQQISGAYDLWSVVCPGGTASCIGVGEAADRSGGVVVTIPTDGSAPTVHRTPAVLTGLACWDANRCIAVGLIARPGGTSGPVLPEHGSPEVTAGAVVSVANGVPSAPTLELNADELNSVGCMIVDECLAGGESSTSGTGTQPGLLAAVGVTDTGARLETDWTLAGTAAVRGVSCTVDGGLCVAVGDNTVAYAKNAGVGWSAPQVVTDFGVPQLDAVSCRPVGIGDQSGYAAVCEAAGSEADGSQPSGTDGVLVPLNVTIPPVQNIVTIVAQPGIVTTALRGGALRGIDCPNAVCTAVGTDGSGAPIALTTNFQSPAPPVPLGISAHTVSCSTLTSCFAAGSIATSPAQVGGFQPLSPVSDLDVTLQGWQLTGSSSPTFTLGSSAPQHDTLSGFTCTSLSNGQPITSALPNGTYMIDPASCTAPTLSGPSADDYRVVLVGGPFIVTDTNYAVGCSVSDLIDTMRLADVVGRGTMNLAAGCTYTLTAPVAGNDGLPRLNGLSSTLLIHGNGATIERSADPATPEFRVLDFGSSGGSVAIDHLTVRGGALSGTTSLGGGILAFGGAPLTLTDVAVTGNSAGEGGGLLTEGTLTVTDSSFTGNSAELDSGGLEADGATTTITGSTFTGNTARRSGAGLFIESLRAHLTNDTIAANHGDGATNGPDAGNTEFVNDTIVGNSANAIRNEDIAYLGNSIISGVCHGPSGPGFDLYSKGNNVEPGSDGCGLSVSGADFFCPNHVCHDIIGTATLDLGALQDNGGPTQTMAVGRDSAAYQVVPLSACPTTDQRGVSRPQPADATACNAGAYETRAVTPVLAYTGPTGGIFDEPTQVSATLADPDTGAAMTGQPVTFTEGSASCTGTTDSAGAAHCALSAADVPASTPYQLTVTTAGGALTGVGADYYAPASLTAPFTITKAPVRLTATALFPAGISASLTEAHTHSPLAGQTLVFAAGHTHLCTATTNANGTATCKLLPSVLVAVVHLGYTVTYSGSVDYLEATAHGSVIGRRP